jgi:hypothetical protein
MERFELVRELGPRALASSAWVARQVGSYRHPVEAVRALVALHPGGDYPAPWTAKRLIARVVPKEMRLFERGVLDVIAAIGVAHAGRKSRAALRAVAYGDRRLTFCPGEDESLRAKAREMLAG